MSFFKFNKEIKTEDLKLSDYDQIWTKFCFLDETGSLNNLTDPFFSVGIIKLSQPYYLMNKILYERNKRNFHDEMHFNKLSRKNIEFAKFALGAFFDAKSTHFYSDKRRCVNIFILTTSESKSEQTSKYSAACCVKKQSFHLIPRQLAAR